MVSGPVFSPSNGGVSVGSEARQTFGAFRAAGRGCRTIQDSCGYGNAGSVAGKQMSVTREGATLSLAASRTYGYYTCICLPV